MVLDFIKLIIFCFIFGCCFLIFGVSEFSVVLIWVNIFVRIFCVVFIGIVWFFKILFLICWVICCCWVSIVCLSLRFIVLLLRLIWLLFFLSLFLMWFLIIFWILKNVCWFIFLWGFMFYLLKVWVEMFNDLVMFFLLSKCEFMVCVFLVMF